MNVSSQKKQRRSLTYTQMVSGLFFKSRLNKISVYFVVFLFAVAIFSPLIANNKPYAVKIEGKVYFPLFAALDAIDYTMFLIGAAAVVIVILIKRNWRIVEPSMRSEILGKQVFAVVLVVLTCMILSFIFVPRKLDTTDYRSLVDRGGAEWGLFAPVPFGYDEVNLDMREHSPNGVHWLGTDDVGADVLARLIHGSRVSLSVGFVAVGISSLIGVFVGAVLGYFGGKVDFVGMRLVEIVSAVPVFFLIITIVAFFPRSLINVMVIIGLTTWTGTARLVRAEFLKLRKMDFVEAARALGLGSGAILFKHMLINGIGPVIVNVSFGIAGAIFTEAALSFLGFGVAPPAPSWGQMLSLGVSSTGGFLWWLSVFPGGAIFLTVLTYNLIGQGLRDAVDPRLKEVV